jgi:RimJ/RimL family protein N-acetyltransferase
MPVYFPTTPDEKRAAIEWAARISPDYLGEAEGEPIVIVRNGEVAAVALYGGFRPGPGIEMSIAASTPLWATRQAVSVLLAYPFLQLGTRRITAMTHKKNKRVHRFLRGVGFRKEGVLLDAYDTGPAIVFGMTRRWFVGSKWNAADVKAKDLRPSSP